MSLLFALSVQAAMAPQTVTPPAASATPAPSSAEPPRDWSTLPAIPLLPASSDMVRFVRDEVKAGRCARHQTTGSGQVMVVVPMALRLNADNGAEAVVPVAIGCPTIEQFSAGAAQRMVRNLPYRTSLTHHRWYRTVITYTWPG